MPRTAFQRNAQIKSFTNMKLPSTSIHVHHAHTHSRKKSYFNRQQNHVAQQHPAHDESMLRHIGYKIDVYLASKAYVADHSDNRELLAVSAITKKLSKRIGPRGPARLHWALCRNAQAFADHANQRYAAAMEAEAAPEFEREREEARDEPALRDANEFAATVQDALDRMDFDDGVDEAEFADAFASDDEADEEEGELEAEGEEEREEEREEEVGEEVDEEVKK